MKSKLRNLLLAAMAVTLFAGCSNIALDDASVESSETNDKCVLTISVDGFTGNERAAARSIDPKKYVPGATGTSTTWKIEGTSARNQPLALAPIDLSSGTGTITLDYDVWYLTLHTYENDVEVLRGVTTVDLNKAVPQISFTLSSKGVTSNGGLNLTVTGLTSAVKSYTAGLYDINTDELKYNFLSSVDGVDLDDGDDTTPLPTSASFTKDNVAPGEYIFKFIPYNDTVANKATREDLTPYSDVITIAPGRTTTASVALSIMQLPAAPTGFSVSLVDASEADKDDYYTVRLNWTDNSDNEENFVLRIYEAAGTETALADVTVDSKLKVKFDKDFMSNNAYYVSGTLGMSTETCDVKLKTGTLYEMTLAAKNRAGESAVCTRTLEPGDNPKFGKKRTDTEGNVITDADGNEEYDLYRINRQKITYNYMGGTRTKGTNKTVGTGEDIVSSDLNEVIYRTYDGTAYTLMTIAGTDYAVDDTSTPDVDEATNTDKLIYNDHPWSMWTDLPNAGSQVSTIAANVFADKMVYASYNQNVNVTYTVTDEYRTLDVSWSCTADGATADTTNNKLELNVTSTPTVTGENIVFNIADTYTPYPTADNPTPAPVAITSCDKIIIIINGGKPIIRDNPAKSGSNYPYTLNLNNFRTSGVYNITVIGEIDGHYYSGPVIPLTVDIK